VWTSIDSRHDGGFVAGLIAGDGCFWIRPNNSGASWACGLGIRLRADDTPLLARLCRWSGIGSLYAVPAQAKSKPQTLWAVQRQADCLKAIGILDRNPLLNKKRGDYEIWRRAVLAWTGTHTGRAGVVAECADRLRAHRLATNIPRPVEVSITGPQFLAFLAGFVTAEAHFGVTLEGHPRFVINLRRDDAGILGLCRDRLGIGYLASVPPRGTSRAACSWRVTRLTDLRVLTGYLDGHPPRGRVFRIYEAWREVVLLQDRRGGGLLELAARVRERRAYKPGLESIVPVDQIEARRARYRAVLRAWAQATEPPRTATAYEAWRRNACSDAPTRNTIAAAFGSWVAALKAAGLSVTGCRSRRAIATAQATAAAENSARRARRRRKIIAAVRECARALGRHPTLTEFFRWRNRHAPDAPSHATVYRAFPEGWQSVLEAVSLAESSRVAADLLQPPPQPLDVAPAPREHLAREPHVEAGAADQLGHEGVAGHEVAARQRE
jgi:LAGLIDADG endonuclease